MTRRERLEAKLERRETWADKATQRAAQRFTTAHNAVAGIPFGQPVLVGHHSEGAHRAALDRCDTNMRRGVEETHLAEHHSAKAAGLASQLERSVFSDDADAIEQLRAKIAKLEAERDRMKEANAAFREGGRDALAALSPRLAETWDSLKAACPYERQPFPSYSLTNRGAEIRRCEKRIAEITAHTARTEQATASGGTLVEGTGDYCRVTFSERPTRQILDALKAAGFHWGAGSWVGRRDALPACVQPTTEKEITT